MTRDMLLHPSNMLQLFNFKNFYILQKALRHEQPWEIYRNFLKRMNLSRRYLDHIDKDEKGNIETIKSSVFFDAEYYINQLDEGLPDGKEPVEHYLNEGGFSGKNPSSFFDSAFYLESNSDVDELKINPLLHYLKWGQAEGRSPVPDINENKSAEHRLASRSYISDLNTILFVAHDGYMAGAEVFLLDLLRWVKENTTINFKIIFLNDGGPLVKEFAKLAPVFVWPFCNTKSQKLQLAENLQQFCPKAKLIYGNTILSTKIYSQLSYLNAPIITHVHELDETIKLFRAEGRIDNFAAQDQTFIACSPSVAENLIHNYNIPAAKVPVVNSFIKVVGNDAISENRSSVRKTLRLDQDSFIVWGCGTIYPRKGTDYFIETAIALKQLGVENFHFYWIGKNYWDNGKMDKTTSEWHFFLEKIEKNNLQDRITFLGEQLNAPSFFSAGDLFYLPSREDPFPLVCLEAAQFALPVICFDGAGGMPEFVSTDAGVVIPMGDTESAANAIAQLMNDREKLNSLGEKARLKVLDNFSLETGARKILEICNSICNFQPTVSVIVPNYNYAHYLDRRIDSILSQTFRDFEVIILDDCSTDNSLEIIEKYSKIENVRVARNSQNSGNVFSQWELGIQQAKGELIWIAEADDFCSPDFLNNILPFFNDRDVALTYCDSYQVDETGEVIGNYRQYYDALDLFHWKSDYITTGNQEINYGLGAKNTIPNASAVVFRRSDYNEQFLKLSSNFRLSGDWMFYIQLMKDKKIGYCSSRLNYHRKHSQTVTSQSHNRDNRQKIIDEALEIHRYVIDHFVLSRNYLSCWNSYIKSQIVSLFPNVVNFNNVYPLDEVENLIAAKLGSVKKFDSIILVSNSLNMTGAPLILYHIGKILHEQYHLHCITFAYEDGELNKRFKALGDVYIVENNRIRGKHKSVSAFLSKLKNKPQLAFVNTIDACQLIPDLKKCGIGVLTAIHDYTYSYPFSYLDMVYTQSDHIIYSVDFMLQKNKIDYPDIDMSKVSIIPQGLYQTDLLKVNKKELGEQTRKKLNIPSDAFVVFGCGSIKPIKGVDVFVNTAIEVISAAPIGKEIHFVWLGGYLRSNSSDMYTRFLHRDIVNTNTQNYIHFIEKDSAVEKYFSIADLFLLSSREDPFPSVVIESMTLGIPVIAIEGSTGSAELIKASGNFLVDYSNRASLSPKIIELIENPHLLREASENGRHIIQENYQFSEYVKSITHIINDKFNLQI